MDYPRILKTFQDLLERAEYGDKIYRDDQPYQRFGVGAITIAFRGNKNVREFVKAVDELWKIDKELYETYSLKTFQEKFIKFLRRCKQGEECSLETIKIFFKELRSEKVRTYKVLYPVFGAEYCKENPLVVGPFTLYNPKVHRQHLLNKYPHSKEILVAAYDPNPENKKLEELEKRRVKVVIGVSIEARETKSANEKALIKLRQFENFIRFMIGDQENNYDVGIFNFNEIKYTTGIFLCDETAGSTSSLTGTFEKISLNKFPINDPKYGHDRLWLMLDKKKPNDLEKRILSAVTWVGKGLRDEEPARAFVQYVFALEALLQLQQDSLVSPSITYAISEMSAFIIAENLENRLLIEDMVKRIYKKRSAIAHGGTHEVEAALLQDALWLIRVLISLLLINEEFKDIKSIDDLSKWVKKQKYSS